MGHSSLHGDSRSHECESSRGSLGVQVCPSERLVSLCDPSYPKEQLADAANGDGSPGRTRGQRITRSRQGQGVAGNVLP